MNPADFRTVIDLRAPEQPPLGGRRPILRLSLADIEEGRHTLSAAGGPYLVVCERGAHSGLAARYLRADGLEAQAWQGTLAELGEAWVED